MGTINGGTIISFAPTPSLHAGNSRMPSHQNGCNFTFQIPSIANAAKKNTNSAERRANHNAVERARRECLNTKFQELAHALPSLAQVRRPSKSIIVQKSLEFIYNAQQKDKLHEKQIRGIRGENDTLREEINKLREQLGLEPLPPREESRPTTPSTDDAKEDAKISSPHNTETQNEADDNTTANNSAQGSTSSVNDPIIKSEDNHSDDDEENSGTHTDDEYEMESTDIIDRIDGLIYPTLLDPSHGFTSDFDFSMELPIDQMVDAPGLTPLNFDSHNGITDDIAFCSHYPLTQKFYPSPPYEAAMLDFTGHLSGFTMPSETSQI